MQEYFTGGHRDILGSQPFAQADGMPRTAREDIRHGFWGEVNIFTDPNDH